MNELNDLLRALAQSIGNKVYLNDIEKLISRIELTPQDKQALRYLASDIQRLKTEANRSKLNPFI